MHEDEGGLQRALKKDGYGHCSHNMQNSEGTGWIEMDRCVEIIVGMYHFIMIFCAINWRQKCWTDPSTRLREYATKCWVVKAVWDADKPKRHSNLLAHIRSVQEVQQSRERQHIQRQTSERKYVHLGFSRGIWGISTLCIGIPSWEIQHLQMKEASGIYLLNSSVPKGRCHRNIWGFAEALSPWKESPLM